MTAAGLYAESTEIDRLVSNARLAKRTAELARIKIGHTLDLAREYDRLRREFDGIAAELDELEPCRQAMRGRMCALSDMCRYCNLTHLEHAMTVRLDVLQGALTELA